MHQGSDSRQKLRILRYEGKEAAATVSCSSNGRQHIVFEAANDNDCTGFGRRLLTWPFAKVAKEGVRRLEPATLSLPVAGALAALSVAALLVLYRTLMESGSLWSKLPLLLLP